MPAAGWKSSDFGSHYDPYYLVWQLHAGVDIAADGGQPIYAAADGAVIMAGRNGGYGNYTCSHGRYGARGLSTWYAQQSRILVSDGQRVRRGQVIGRVGTRAPRPATTCTSRYASTVNPYSRWTGYPAACAEGAG
jgi:murein DD-endopeptidase MepM/ murein hydrolase activator NlpD